MALMSASFTRAWVVPAFLRGERRILILGMTPLAEQILHEIECRPGCRHTVIGVLDDVAPSRDHSAGRLFLGPLCRLQSVVDELKPNRIVIALAERRGKAPMRALLESCVSDGVIVEDASEFYERFTGKLALESLTPMRVIASGRFRPSRFHQAFIRILSLLTALVALVALSPLLALIAMVIKLDSRGPVVFAHKHVGAQGRPFTLLKFRTTQNNRKRWSEWEGDNHDHVTRVGKWLRRYRFDELLQLVNILRGEMNLVGPQPHPVSNFELSTRVARNLNELSAAAIGCYAQRLVVRPGLTGWAQVRCPSASNPDEEIEKLRYDFYYVKYMSPWLDLRILLESIKVLPRDRVVQDIHRGAAEGDAGSFGFSRKVGRTTEA